MNQFHCFCSFNNLLRFSKLAKCLTFFMTFKTLNHIYYIHGISFQYIFQYKPPTDLTHLLLSERSRQAYTFIQACTNKNKINKWTLTEIEIKPMGKAPDHVEKAVLSRQVWDIPPSWNTTSESHESHIPPRPTLPSKHTLLVIFTWPALPYNSRSLHRHRHRHITL